MTNPHPNAPDAADQCATCGHQRWRHKQVDGQQVCTEYVDCACQGHFVEISAATHMARFVQAAQKFAGSIVTVRAAMTDAMRSFHDLHAAMQQAGLLDEPSLCDGCDRTDHPVTASPDGRALLCPDCQAKLAAQEEPARTPALQQLTTWHTPDCDKQCGGTCTHGAANIIANAVGVPVEAVTGPSPDGLPDHWSDAAPITGKHAEPTDLEVTAHIPSYTEYIPQRGPIEYQRSEELQTAARVGNSCATCWPRPCDPARSECRRQVRTRTQDDLQGPVPDTAGDVAPEDEHGPNCVRYGCPHLPHPDANPT